MYSPDKWVILKITDKKSKGIIYRVLAGWSGGYLGGDAWRLNSGITQIEEIGQVFDIHGHTGSVYRCHKQAEGLNAYTSGVLNSWTEKSKDTTLIEVVGIETVVSKFI